MGNVINPRTTLMKKKSLTVLQYQFVMYAFSGNEGCFKDLRFSIFEHKCHLGCNN